jgi:hypothetical protein
METTSRTDYSKKYYAQHKDRLKKLQLENYNLYADDFITCPYCCKLVSLYYSKQHLKTKKCCTLQNLLDKDTYNNLYLDFTRTINKLKSDLLLKDDVTVL